MTQETTTNFKIDDWVGLPEIKTKFDIPPDFYIETPKFKKTRLMERIQFECNDLIERLIGWKCLIEGKTDAQIGKELDLNKGTVKDWRRKIGIRKSFS